MERLENTVLEYAWGSRTALADLCGRPSPTARPQAELWMGAHPAAPSVVASTAATLREHIAADPDRVLGERVARRFGGELPFLLKVLAADQPLSLQAHPNAAQAREGFDREERAGLARDAFRRCYKDTNHKPEILCAMGPFEALCGFRDAAETAELFASLRCDSLAPDIAQLRGAAGVRGAFEALMTTEAATRARLLDELAAAARAALQSATRWPDELRWSLALSERYPGDMGAASALLLNFVRLESGQAMYLPAGNLHAYLHGVGIELMANSDNVLRGGLTPKHVDLGELLHVLDFRSGPVALVPVRDVCDHEREYRTPTPDFRLSVIELACGAECRPARRGPEILLCLQGEASIEGGDASVLRLRRGESVFVAAGDGRYLLTGAALDADTGAARLVRATVGSFE
jgi:mannose-6-phosphate isomerase